MSLQSFSCTEKYLSDEDEFLHRSEITGNESCEIDTRRDLTVVGVTSVPLDIVSTSLLDPILKSLDDPSCLVVYLETYSSGFFNRITDGCIIPEGGRYRNVE